jgi:colanic acid/amylovoran biosynthesis protein
MKILLVGMAGLYNRGCEAILWGSSQILTQIWPESEITAAVGTLDTLSADEARLPDLGLHLLPMSRRHRLNLSRPARGLRWTMRNLRDRLGLINEAPGFPLEGWDLVLEVGGDTFVGRPSMAVRRDRFLMSRGLPLGLWGMNLEPYSEAFSKRLDMPRFLSDLDLITVRDQASADYLAGLGVTDHVYRMGDPAFEMEPDPWDCEECFPTAGERGVVGLNLSPLAAEVMKDGQQSMIRLGLQTCRRLIEAGFGVLLVPHCAPPACPPTDSDLAVLGPVYRQFADEGAAVGILPDGLSARQIKYAISHCALFAGARMHSTIAAWSTGVPTLTLSYSRKSTNLSREIYGVDDYAVSLSQADAADIHGRLLKLADSHDEMQALTREGVARLRAYTAQMVEQLRAEAPVACRS